MNDISVILNPKAGNKQGKLIDIQQRNLFYVYEKETVKIEIERRKSRLGFRSQSRLKRNKRSPLLYLLIIALLIYIFLKLSGKI